MFLFQFIVLQVIVFSAVIFFLKKILYGDTQSAINRLDRVYQQLLAKQKELTQKIEEAEKDYNLKKEEAAQIKDKMIQQANEEARQKLDEVVKTARTQAEEIIKKAQSSTEQHYQEIEKKVMAKQTEMAASLLQGSLSEKMASVMHHELVKEFLQRGKEFDLSNVDPSIKKVIVKSPIALERQEKDQIKSFVIGKMNREIEVEELQDKGLIAGVVFQFGSLLMDGTLSNYIKQTALNEQQRIEKGG